MTDAKWKWAFASVRGTSHIKSEMPCQDQSDCRVIETSDGRSVLVAVVADGAGSAKQAEVGAELACNLFQSEMTEFFGQNGLLSSLTRKFMQNWLTRFQSEATRRADSEGLKLRDYACTLLAAIVEGEQAVMLQIGDGAIVYSTPDAPDEYGHIFWPQKGEYENQTYFATDEAATANMNFVSVNEYIQDLSLFTDGIQRLALHFQSKTAHTPFFRMMFSPLRSVEAGYSETLSTSLAAFLDSPQVNNRTDDDKTLVLATRQAKNDATLKEDKPRYDDSVI